MKYDVFAVSSSSTGASTSTTLKQAILSTTPVKQSGTSTAEVTSPSKKIVSIAVEEGNYEAKLPTK